MKKKNERGSGTSPWAMRRNLHASAAWPAKEFDERPGGLAAHSKYIEVSFFCWGA